MPAKGSPKKPTRAETRIPVRLSREERTLIALYRLSVPFMKPIVRRVTWEGLSRADRADVDYFYERTIEEMRLGRARNLFARFFEPLDDEGTESIVKVLGLGSLASPDRVALRRSKEGG